MPYRHRWISGLSLRIFAVNGMALVVLAFGLLYVSRYQQELIEGELDGLERQAQIYAGAIAEAARYSSLITAPQPDMGVMVRDSLSRERTRNMVRRLGETTPNRIRVFNDQGRMIGDSDILGGAGGVIRMQKLPPMKAGGRLEAYERNLVNMFIDLLPSGLRLKPYPAAVFGPMRRRGDPFPDVREALDGRPSSTAWTTNRPGHDIILSTAVPVQHLKQVLGVVYVTRDGTTIAESIRQMKLDIIKLFGIALAITFFLSFYLAAGITRPLKRLARAADAVRRGNRQAEIPDLTARDDEIGDLSQALRDMTAALASRLDTIERFAADVSHELKNPLTSLRSAIETVQLVREKADRDKLMGVIMHDIQRLDRLISDISSASRLDAELGREDLGLVDLRPLLTHLAETYITPIRRLSPDDGPTPVVIDLPAKDEVMIVSGIEGRLGQVFRNLIDNALSFSPSGATVTIRVARDAAARQWKVMVEDQGPGIPEGKLGAIFDRFYSERPEGEAFGRHSGLGLSIAKQIVDAHRGRIYAENILDENGNRKGARFTVALNALA
ncbi:MAG: stimulus-sensing domain-containing protein [Rhodospirillales bacterium]|nr:stimulus-sensing domain-containing protein [Alphaproteobacteria bacterium]MCB9986688.1 stimulus-sensing domain-containing protein [Rhodospirillales bacterium]USO08593.1 MAG: stimulus-sensing domain-containing protein [Rhodospirillales bacterium]